MVVKIRTKVIKNQGSIEKNGKKTLILFIIIPIGFPGTPAISAWLIRGATIPIYNIAMRIDIITVLPEMLEGFVNESILARAQ